MYLVHTSALWPSSIKSEDIRAISAFKRKIRKMMEVLERWMLIIITVVITVVVVVCRIINALRIIWLLCLVVVVAMVMVMVRITMLCSLHVENIYIIYHNHLRRISHHQVVIIIIIIIVVWSIERFHKHRKYIYVKYILHIETQVSAQATTTLLTMLITTIKNHHHITSPTFNNQTPQTPVTTISPL